MNPWVYILVFAVVIFAGVILLSFLFSVFVTSVGGKFAEKTIARYEKKTEQLLPGTNCGDCGQKTCAECAALLLRKEVDDNVCPHISEDMQKQIAGVRDELLKLMEDPTPPERKRKRSFWNKKFGGKKVD
ncbi:MAG: hypothetical protein IJU01_01690 [Lachnospiraceae bacterium]|nr:hypothetical protein [Lachnospiraceae bacterium]